ncbi:MAG: dethiobiotin synthase [Cycloclasticus sp.]|nr:dethiobiotin synthase [Cycloclasticus sp.]
MARGFFITGTDTDVGKTTVALGLMLAFKKAGLSVAAFKPVSAGCIQTNEGLRNDDAAQLMHQASVELPYNVINPYAFEPAIAPHIAAQEANVKMDVDTLIQAYQKIAAEVDVVIVEGAGGWLVPLNATQTMADVANVLLLDVIQVVGIKLGCINHALLTEQAILQHKLNPAGWIANQIQPETLQIDELEDFLQSRLRAPMLGSIPFNKPTCINKCATELDLSTLLKQL